MPLVGHGFYNLARGCLWRGRDGQGGSLPSQGKGQKGSWGCWPSSVRWPNRPTVGGSSSMDSHSILIQFPSPTRLHQISACAPQGPQPGLRASLIHACGSCVALFFSFLLPFRYLFVTFLLPVVLSFFFALRRSRCRQPRPLLNCSSNMTQPFAPRPRYRPSPWIRMRDRRP